MPAVGSHGCNDDRETEPGAAHVAASPIIKSGKALEDDLALVEWHAAAVVIDDQFRTARRRRTKGDGNG